MTKQSLRKEYFFWFLIIIFVDYSYLVFFTFDSALYLELSLIIGGDLPWANWDPIRGIIFPLLLRISTFALGMNNNSFVALYTILNIILFYCFSTLIIEQLKITNQKAGFLVNGLIFFCIMIDPIIFGYYHVALTEAVAASIMTLSVCFAYRIYKNTLESSPPKKNFPYLLFFLIFVPFSWHLKQPYVFITLVPFLLSFILVLVKSSNRKAKQALAINLLLIILFLGLSIITWNRIIRDVRQNTPDRTSEAWITKELHKDFLLLKTSPFLLVKKVVDNYLALSNIYFFDQSTGMIDESISFFRTSENGAIAYQVFENLDINVYYLPENLQSYVQNYIGVYHPPERLNTLFKERFIISNFLFSFLYLLLPLIVVIQIILLSKRGSKVEFEMIGLSTVLSNAVIFSITSSPIDRYVFPGYPLLLTILLFNIIVIIKKLMTKINNRIVIARKHDGNC